MNITVIGAGYVGLVTAAAFAELGNNVACVDSNCEKIANLKNAQLPIYEPGLEVLVKTNLDSGRIQFFTELTETPHPNVIFIAVGTPSDSEGAADLQYVKNAAKDIGEYLNDYCVVVDKSTVPVGMADDVREIILSSLKNRKTCFEFDVVSNPEFLREGAAIDDFLKPERIIIGLNSERAKQIMLKLYLPIIRHEEKIYFMSIRDAEMTKYAANAMLATRISFMNEISILCECMGVDIENVRKGIGSDSRIGSSFLYAGCGYGGSCFPKDVRALIRMAEKRGLDPLILKAVENRNNSQKQLLSENVIKIFGEDLSNIKIAVWGLSFKPETDDMRDASSIIFLTEVIERGAVVAAYDPAAMHVARNMLNVDWFKSSKLQLVDEQYEATYDADVLVLITEWKSFLFPNLELLAENLRQKIIIDGRNQYDPLMLKDAGFSYYGVGRGDELPTLLYEQDVLEK